MTVALKGELTQEYVASISDKLKEPDWLRQKRLEGFKASQSLKLPKPEKTAIHDWNVSDFILYFDQSVYERLADLPEEVQRFIKPEAQVVVHKDGRPVFSQVGEQLKKKGVIFADLNQAVREHGDLVRRYMHQLVQLDEHKLTAIHGALFNCGIFIYVPEGTQVDIPLQAIWWQESEQAGLLPHVILVAEKGSKVTYLEHALGGEKGAGVNHYVAEVFVGPGANVTFAALDNFESPVTNFVWRRARVEQDGHIDWALGQMHDGHTLSENLTVLEGNGSRADSKSVTIGRGQQSQNFVQKIIHIGRASEGYILGHAVMKDQAKGIFNGISKMEKGASKANGQQTERVLMLSDQARGDANPILLIDEDDVKASHAASVGQMDQTQLYYLMSRGIPKEEAERLIILGFLNPVVEKIPLESLKQQLIHVIERKVKQ